MYSIRKKLTVSFDLCSSITLNKLRFPETGNTKIHGKTQFH